MNLTDELLLEKEENTCKLYNLHKQYLYFFKPNEKTNILIIANNNGRVRIVSIPEHKTFEMKSNEKEMEDPIILFDGTYDKLYGTTSIYVIQMGDFKQGFGEKSMGRSLIKKEKFCSIHKENEQLNNKNFLIVYTIFGSMHIFEISLSKLGKHF